MLGGMQRSCPMEALNAGRVFPAWTLTQRVAIILVRAPSGPDPACRCRPRRSGVIWRARADSVPLHLSRAAASLDAGRGHVRRLGSAPLELRMSRSSPGRYAPHDFAKNVYDVRAFDADGRELVDDAARSVRLDGADARRRVDRAVQGLRRSRRRHVSRDRSRPTRTSTCRRPSCGRAASTTAPSTLDLRPARRARAGRSRRSCIRAPRLRIHRAQPSVPDGQPGGVRPDRRSASSRSDGRTFRFAAASHRHRRRARRVRQGRREDRPRARRRSYGEYPAYEPGHYTFLADYLPYADGDAMEHRNSTVMTSSRSRCGTTAIGLLDTVAHEFFHGWNVERIRPRSLEPFDFERANMSGELWLAEGFTQYYGPLSLSRAGLVDAARRPPDAGRSSWRA